MSNHYRQIVTTNEVLREKSLEEQNHLPYKILAEKLKVFSFYKLTAAQKTELKKKRINSPDDFYVNVQNNSAVEQAKCQNLITLMDVIANDKSSYKTTCAWQTIRDFWYRAKAYDGKNKNSKVNLVLDPISKVCGYEDFKDFVEQEFKLEKEKFKILVLPFTGDILERKDAETLLVKRYHVLSEKEDLPVTVSYEHILGVVYFTHELARQIGIEKKADLLIFGDLYLRNNDKAEINLEYALVRLNPLTEAHNWSSNVTPFRFSELSNGHLPTNIDYIVYWSLGIEAYQNKKYDLALEYFGKVVNDLQKEDDEVCFRMGVIYDLRNEKENAVLYYKKALSNNKSHYNTLLNLGIRFLLDGNAEEAKKYLEQFLESFTQPENNTLYEIGRTYLGVSLKSLGEITLAEKYLTDVTDYAQRNPQLIIYAEIWGKAYFELGEIYFEAATEHHEEDCYIKAKEFFYHAAKWSKDNSLHERIAYYLQSFGAIEEAYEVIKRAHPLEKSILPLYRKYVDKAKL